MKRFVIAAAIMLVAVSTVFAQAFQPPVMSMSAPDNVLYDFDGTTMSLDVTVNGAPANSVFAVFTKGKGSEIAATENGFLGWHYVNGIDTCVYYASGVPLQEGSNTISWDGTDNDGGQVPEGEYTYYVWGYDNVNPKIVAAPIPFGWNEMDTIQIYAADGTYLNEPVIWDGGHRTRTPDEDHIPIEAIHNKWYLGNDPEDTGLIETTMVYAAEDLGSVVWDENAPEYWFKADGNAGGNIRIIKYLWVPNGESEIQEDWGDAGVFEFTLPNQVASTELHMPLATVKGGEHIFVVNHDYITGVPISELIYVTLADGYEDTRVDLARWWVRMEDGDAGAQAGGGPSDVINAGEAGPGAGEGLLHLSSHGSCINQVIDPYRYGEVGGDVEDITLWVNGNGDYVGDHNANEDAERPWVCHDYYPGPYKYWTTTDANGFAQFPTYDMGAVSFGLYLPDGTGVDRFAFAGDTAGQKGGQRILQYGGAFDGMYSDGQSIGEGGDKWWFTPHTSIKGTISKTQVAVDDDAPAAFAVAQNSPNPFNPSTTISFSIAEAGQVDIDVFNVAGQKIDTIASEHLSAGNHTVTWDASEFSAGVYFYTVKADGFSKTMKMTLLK